MADRLARRSIGSVRKLSLLPARFWLLRRLPRDYGPITKTWAFTTTTSRLPDDPETGDGPGRDPPERGRQGRPQVRSGALVIRADKATGRNATITLKTSGRTVRLTATTKVRVASARRVGFTV